MNSLTEWLRQNNLNQIVDEVIRYSSWKYTDRWSRYRLSETRFAEITDCTGESGAFVVS